MPSAFEIRTRARFQAATLFAMLLSLVAVQLSACASLSNMQERYVACSYETAWQAATDTLAEYPLETQDKDKGLIETAWVEMPVHGRPYGLLKREGLGDKERFRTTLTLHRRPDLTVVQLTERREHFGFRGGARIYQWYPVEPSEELMHTLAQRLTTIFEERGCFVGT